MIGDPTEGALICLAEKAGVRGMHQRLHLNPFESIRRENERGGETLSPSRADDLRQRRHGGDPSTMRSHSLGRRVRPLTDSDRQRIVEENDAMANRGLRVLTFAYRDRAELDGTPYTTTDVETSLVYLGLVALSDPVRPEVPEAIHACHTAGIRVIMVTGDYALTAASIAKQIGLGQDQPLRSFTGAEVSEMDDDGLRAILEKGETIFARVAPEHKLGVVSRLKEMGEIVAVTGDGVNDAPALKKADIGIAMGQRGNDVAKEAARMILTDDNFSSSSPPLKRDARFDNLRRFWLTFSTTTRWKCIRTSFGFCFPGCRSNYRHGRAGCRCRHRSRPTDGLGIEPPERGIMDRPTPSDMKLLSIGLSCRIISSRHTRDSQLLRDLPLFRVDHGYWRPGLSLLDMPQSPED